MMQSSEGSRLREQVPQEVRETASASPNHVRYECIMEPCDTWTIWDNLTAEPAISADRFLVGLAKEEARSICDSFNKLA